MRLPESVLFVDNTSTFGGAILSLSALVKGMRGRGVKPIVVSGQPRSRLVELFPGCQVYSMEFPLPWMDQGRLGKHSSKKQHGIQGKMARTVYWLFRQDLLPALKLAAIGRDHRVELVHLNNGTDSQLSGLLAARILGLPCIAHHRGFLDGSAVSDRVQARMATHHIAISGAVRDRVLSLGVEDHRVSTVYNSLDLDDFAPGRSSPKLRTDLGIPSERSVIGHFGRIVRWKGQLEFLAGFAEVLGKAPEAHALIVGDTSDGGQAYLEEVMKRVKALGVGEHVTFTGYRADVRDLMRLCDVTVHSSIIPEPFGRVVIESMACGIPVVAAAEGGPLEIIADGEDGFLVDPRDPRAMALAILRILQDPKQAARISQVGAHTAKQRFSPDRCADETLQVYETALSRSWGSR